ncbi:uncharacterized protein LOC113237013 [Hyposmocoma kahamanoa]|uniref:uncharacterized protein LOC113237013 n=1 Tax=Hyposmocoma kahamanoa TaxID=1477025 RepID=UPI000E6D5BA9|nr:uncharacterized protein LOC113237013 [Hyposmocoma kahamanoa]
MEKFELKTAVSLLSVMTGEEEAARDYTSLKDTIRAAKEEELSCIRPETEGAVYFGQRSRGSKTNLEDDLRGGRPETAVTAENVWTSEMLVREDPRITYTNIEKILGISSGSVNTILHQHLGVRKLCCRWIPRLLSGTEKQARVDWCREMLIRFENGTSRRVSEIVTGDETWIYQYDPESKK